MSNFDNVELVDLVDRYNYLIKIYIPLAAEIAPKLDKFGKIRQELQVISSEFTRRGYVPESPEEFVKVVEEEIKKRGSPSDVNQASNTNEGNTEPRKDT